jgi:hypothetical protein
VNVLQIISVIAQEFLDIFKIISTLGSLLHIIVNAEFFRLVSREAPFSCVRFYAIISAFNLKFGSTLLAGAFFSYSFFFQFIMSRSIGEII